MVKLMFITPNAESNIAYMARVSSDNQNNPDFAGLLRYCIEHKHWSIFEQAYATFEIVTSRVISAQLLRHRSFTFQEFSTRYAKAQHYIPFAARRQDSKNRQNSIDDLPEAVKEEWLLRQEFLWNTTREHYEWALEQGIAKECARAILPLQTQTTLYMTGTIRSWIHYLQVRCDADPQLEHRELALAIRKKLAEHLPNIAAALGE